MDEEGLPRRMFETGCEPTGRKRVNNYFTLRWVETIKPALDAEYREMLDNSQFRRLMSMVTGLNCEPLPVTESSKKRKRDQPSSSKRSSKAKAGKGRGRMWTELFGEFKKPTPAWLLEKLLMGRKYKDPLTRFRLALLLLVEGVLCPKSGTMYLDPEVVEMVRDVDAFIKYSWGQKVISTNCGECEGKNYGAVCAG
ncbi:unnamed protein product [Microthlaspi erraticum]|uniref:DUF1985 domain-containing protein n=1 Tax=Microthlaspi erraticum TaxID=1685480 RepID=A0A6D2JGD0_9BRAS|nr:unnamed protein product [Microthlaspi erraticum]